MTAEDIQRQASKIYDAMAKYNRDQSAMQKTDPEGYAQAQGEKAAEQRKMKAKSEVQIKTVANVTQIEQAMEEGRKAAQDEAAAEKQQRTAETAAKLQESAMAEAKLQGTEPAAERLQAAVKTAERRQESAQAAAQPGETLQGMEPERRVEIDYDDESYEGQVRAQAGMALNSLIDIYEGGQLLRSAVSEEISELRAEGYGDEADALEAVYAEYARDEAPLTDSGRDFDEILKLDTIYAPQQESAGPVDGLAAGIYDKAIAPYGSEAARADALNRETAALREAGDTVTAENLEAIGRRAGLGAYIENAAQGKTRTAENGGENYGTQGQRNLRNGGSVQRDAGASAEIETGRVAEGAGREESTGSRRNIQTERGSESQGAEKVRSAESTDRRGKSSKEIIGGAGAEDDSISILPKNKYTASVREAENLAKEYGYDIKFVTGALHILSGDGRRISIDGVIRGNQIVVNAGSVRFTPVELTKHEIFHGILDANPEFRSSLAKQILDSMTPQELAEAFEAYYEAYDGAYTDDIETRIEDEMLADMYAGMDRVNLGLAQKYGEMVREAAAGVDAGNGNEVRYSSSVENRKGEEKQKIAAGMTDDERTAILRNKTIQVPVYAGQADESINKNKEDLESSELKIVKKALIRIGEETGAYSTHKSSDLNVNVRYTKESTRESVQKQYSGRQLEKLLPVLEKAVETAVCVETHDNRYFADESTKYYHELIGGYVDGKDFVPVRFGIKEFKNGSFLLHVTICQEKIKTEVIEAKPPKKIGNDYTSLSVNISLARLVNNVNTSDCLRYIPDDMLNKGQKDIKYAEIVKTIEYTNRKNDNKYNDAIKQGNVQTIQRIVDSAAKAAGYTPVYVYHQTAAENITQFDTGISGAGDNDSETPNGIFLKTNDHDIGLEGKKQMKLYLQEGNKLHFKDRKEANAWYCENVAGYASLQEEMKTELEKYTEQMEVLEDRMFSEEVDGTPEYDELDEKWNKLLEDLREVENGYRGKLRKMLDDYFLSGKSGYNSIELDYDGHRYVDGKREDVHTFIAFDGSQVKSAETITYDDDGNVIPISKRFNKKTKDIRYSLVPDDTATADEKRAEIAKLEAEIENRSGLLDPGSPHYQKARDEILALELRRNAAAGELHYQLEREAAAKRAETAKLERESSEKLTSLAETAKEEDRAQKEARRKYEETGDAARLEEAEQHRKAASEARKARNKLKKNIEQLAGKKAQSFVPRTSIKQTTNRLLDLFHIQAGSRAESRALIGDILTRSLANGYVSDAELRDTLTVLYANGITVERADPIYESAAELMHGARIYVSPEVKAEFGDDWNTFRQAMMGARMYAVNDESARGIDSYYGELSDMAPGIFDAADMRGMLEDILDAVQRGKPVHRTLADTAKDAGIGQEEDFEAYLSETIHELARFADAAGIESSTLARNAEKTGRIVKEMQEHFEKVREDARERREHTETMDKLRRKVKSLQRLQKVNNESLTAAIKDQNPETQVQIRNILEQLAVESNRLTKRGAFTLGNLKAAYEEWFKEHPNYPRNEAVEARIRRLDNIHTLHASELSLDELQAVVDAVDGIGQFIKTREQMATDAYNSQISDYADTIRDEIDFANQIKTKNKTARNLWGEGSLSPSRALMRLVGYDKGGMMAKLVKRLEDGDIAEMDYKLRTDMIFKDFLDDSKNAEWLKKASGKNAAFIREKIPKIMGWDSLQNPETDSIASSHFTC